MAALETIRVKFGVLITVLIAVALLSFIIDPTTLQSVASSMSSKNDVGEINGKSISIIDYQAEVDKYTTINEMMTGSAAQNEQQHQFIRETAWKSLVDKFLFEKNARKAGLNVGTEEMNDMIAGNIESQFTQFFADEYGVFSPDRVREFIAYKDSDQTGRAQLLWNYFIESAKTQEFYAKYFSLFNQSNFVNPLTVANRVADNNNTFDVEFVMVPYGYSRDTAIVVSDKEIKEFYNAHKDAFKQKASRDVEYVVFEVKPSEEDIAATNQAVIDVYENFSTTNNMKAFLLANSDRQYDERWYKPGELNIISRDVNDYAFGDKASVSEVITKGNTFYAVRVMESAMVPDSVYVKLVPAASENVDSLLNAAEPVWIPQTPGFENVMTVKKGQKATVNGYVFQVVDRTEPVAKKKVAVLEKTAVAGKKTTNDYYSKANTFASKTAGKYENFQKALEEEGVSSHTSSRMLEGADNLGAITGTKEVSRWAFEAKNGQASSIITINNDYFIIAAVKGVHKEGYTPVEEVSSMISNILYTEKAAQKKAAEIAGKIEGLTDMEAVASALNTSVSTKEGVAFSSMSAPGLDPKFIGAASVSEDGKICGPVAGTIGVYVYKVTGRDTGAAYTEDDAKVMDGQMAQYSSQMLVPVMMLDADVQDNRTRFY